MNLTIRTDSGDFDLFDSEQIVQTLGVFSFEDITSRSGDYSNTFTLPLTNNNRAIINYADFISSVNTAPYKKIPIKLLLDGFEFKSGHLVVQEVDENIRATFFSGNTNFFSLINQITLRQLDWQQYDHIWNYTNAVASSANTSGYFYPLVDYNLQNLAGDIVDIRKILPTTFNKTILSKVFEYAGYSYIENYDTTEFNQSVLPYSKRNPEYSAATILLNSLDGTNTAAYGFNKSITTPYIINYDPYGGQNQFVNFSLTDNLKVNIIATGTGSYWNSLDRVYTSVTSGVYDYSSFIDFVDYGVPSTNTSTYSFVIESSDFTIPPVVYEINSFYQVIKVSGGVEEIIEDANIGASYTITGDVFLAEGDQLFIRYGQRGVIIYRLDTTAIQIAPSFDFTLYPTIKNTNTILIELQPGIVFNGFIPYALMLPEINTSAWFKDMCIRFGLIVSVNEDTKTVTLDKFTKIYDNIPSSRDWSDKLDEATSPSVKFSYNNYSQNNRFVHTIDKSIDVQPLGSDFNLVINNQNLELEKTFYTSPFAVSELVDFNGTDTLKINLVDASSKFSKDVKYRIAFSEPVNGIFKFTDGTTTSGYINVRRLWFVDESLPNQTMGFGNLINKNSQIFIDVLNNIKILKCDLYLNVIDINNFDYLIPVYMDKFQSHFFVTKINQFNLKKEQLTEVELIKLN